MGHQRPSTAPSVDGEDAVDNLPIRIDARSAIAFVGAIYRRKEGFQQRPLGVGHVGGIGLSVLHKGFYDKSHRLFLNPLISGSH